MHVVQFRRYRHPLQALATRLPGNYPIITAFQLLLNRRNSLEIDVLSDYSVLDQLLLADVEDLRVARHYPYKNMPLVVSRDTLDIWKINVWSRITTFMALNG